MKELIEEIKGLLSKRELIPKLISLMLAVILWAYIGSTKIGEQKLRLQIESKNLSKSLVISKMQTSFINVILNGNKEELKNVNIKNIRAFVNLENSRIGKSWVYQVEITKNRIPDNIEMSYSPQKVNITVENKISKSIKVLPLITGDLRDGYMLGNIKSTPEYINISGPESVINEINFIETKKINITNETSRINREVSIDTGSYKNVEFSTLSVKVTVPIFESSNIFKFEKKIEMRNKSGSYNYEFSDKRSAILFIKPVNEKIKFSKDEFDIYVDLASLISGKKSPITVIENKKVFAELPIKISIKSNKDDIRFVYTKPDKILIKIIRK